MKRLMVLAALLLFAGLSFSQIPENEKPYINQTLLPATGLLYSQSEDGEMRMRCTTTVIDETTDTYTVVTAAHCGCEDDSSKHIVTPTKTFFFVSPDQPGNKIYLKAKVLGCGYRTKGDDFFLLTIDKTIKFPIVPLGHDPKLMDSFVNVGGPLGLGKQVFFGSVSSPVLDRPVSFEDIQWTGTVLLQEFGVNGGSSGSSAVCLDQHAICAFVVGSIAETTMVAMPVSRLITFREQLAAGKYKWYKSDPDSAPLGYDGQGTGPHTTTFPIKMKLLDMK